MTSAVIVLVTVLICGPLVWLVLLVATSRLARRNGQALRSMSLSFRHGITAEFFEPKDFRAGNHR